MSPTPFRKLLVANRGEIACRVIRSARAMGYETVAIFSDADADAPHVALADEAVRVGPPEVGASYLDTAAILEAARRTGADALHPGYGFLSENAPFAGACEAAGIVFVGPPAAAIEAMGDKARAKARMLEAEVPCVPGYQGDDQSVETLARHAETIGFPVLIKAAAGGGGRGMRRVDEAAALATAVASAQKEAASAFGSDAVLLEKLVEHARHVEVQVFADAHGHAVHLGERDCSAQRRHQKVIEEAPSPAVNPELRARMGAAAVRAATAIGYRGAGTVEFLLDDAGNFYFLEMNTRLQVEHPVTELVTGLDLVELQLKVAAGEPLGITQDQVALRGHAIEARLYAEDPAAGFVPQTGPVLAWCPPAGPGVRCDHGISAGQEITPYYDPMVAKVIAHGRDREEARRRLRTALRETALVGLRHNKRFLLALLDEDRFVEGEMRTGDLDAAMASDPRPAYLQATALHSETLAVAAAMWSLRHGHGIGGAFRSAHTRDFHLALQPVGEADPRSLRVDPAEDGSFEITAPGAEGPVTHHVRLLDAEPDAGGGLRVEIDGLRRSLLAVHAPDRLYLEDRGAQFVLEEPLPRASEDDSEGSGELRAPSSGKVLAVNVATGDVVTAGQAVLSLEAMKIETVLNAGIAGTIRELRAAPGDVVKQGALLAVIEPDPEAAGDPGEPA